MGAKEIADELGLKLNSMRVKCSHLGISLRKPHNTCNGRERASEVQLVANLARPVVAELRRVGAAKRMTAERLAAEVLAIVAVDGLWDAVLDDRGDELMRGAARRDDSRAECE